MVGMVYLVFAKLAIHTCWISLKVSEKLGEIQLRDSRDWIWARNRELLFWNSSRFGVGSSAHVTCTADSEQVLQSCMQRRENVPILKLYHSISLKHKSGSSTTGEIHEGQQLRQAYFLDSSRGDSWEKAKAWRNREESRSEMYTRTTTRPPHSLIRFTSTIISFSFLICPLKKGKKWWNLMGEMRRLSLLSASLLHLLTIPTTNSMRINPWTRNTSQRAASWRWSIITNHWSRKHFSFSSLIYSIFSFSTSSLM